MTMKRLASSIICAAARAVGMSAVVLICLPLAWATGAVTVVY